MISEKKTDLWWTPQLSAPVAAAAAVRLALLIYALVRMGTNALIRDDTSSYLEPAHNMLLHGSFLDRTGLPDLYRTPGYPLFLTLANSAGPGVTALIQVILSVFSVVLVWRLAGSVFNDDRTALVAAWIFAFEPLSVTYSVILLAETLFLTLFLLSLERLVEFLRGHSLRVLAVSGLWLAAATFVRPVTYYMTIALALGLLVALARVPGLRWKAPAVLLLTVLPWLVAWQIRNKVETGFGGFSAVAIHDLYFWEAAEVTADAEHKTVEQVKHEFGSASEDEYVAAHPEQAGWNLAERLKFRQSEAARILKAHRGIFVRKQLKGSMIVAFSPGSADLLMLLHLPVDQGAYNRTANESPLQAAFQLVRAYPLQGAVMAASEIFLLGLYLLAAVGILRGGAPKSYMWLMVGVSLYFVLVITGGAVAVARYRLPVMSLVCVLAAAGALRVMQYFKKDHGKLAVA